MRYPKEQKALTHKKIIHAASTLFRRQGYANVGIDDVMKTAGLTPGGFYAHFKNKEALLAETLTHCSLDAAHSLDKSHPKRTPPLSPLANLIHNYLSEDHLQHPEKGCPLPTLAGELPRQSAKLRRQFTTNLQDRLQTAAHLMPGTTPEQRVTNAFLLLSAMAGTMLVARAIHDQTLALQLLHASRDALLQQWTQPTTPKKLKPKISP